MSSHNPTRRPFILVLSVAAIVTVLSFVPTGFNLGNISLRPIDFFSDLTKKPATILPKHLARKVKKISPVVDTFMVKPGFFALINYSAAATDELKKFFKPLNETQKTKKKKVRIAYFGDSLIEGDIITQDVRHILQKQFGGSGVGFVPITTNVPGFRQTIGHQFSDNWTTISLLDKGHQKIPIGVSGEVFIPAILKHEHIPADTLQANEKFSGSWVAYQSVKNEHTGLDSFYTVKLYYSHANSNAFVTYAKNNGNIITKPLETGNDLKELLLNDNEPIHSIKINFHTPDTLYVYGLSFEKPEGVYVDNFSMRGSSGLPLSELPRQLTSQFNQHLNYNLIILQFGVNVVNVNTKNYDWYVHNFSKTVNYLKTCFPDAAILIASCSDRGIRQNGEYVTLPTLPGFVSSQEDVATETQSVFWNLFKAMGGEGSMVNMVNSDEPLANKDYTHFKSLGGRRVAEYFDYALMHDYTLYQNNLHE